jgi:hypothetical protein
MSRTSKDEAHRAYRQNQKIEAARMKAALLGTSLSIAGMSYTLGKMIVLTFGTRPEDAHAMMLSYVAALLISSAMGYISAKFAQKYARRYDRFNGMLPVRRRTRNPDTPFWR